MAETSGHLRSSNQFSIESFGATHILEAVKGSSKRRLCTRLLIFSVQTTIAGLTRAAFAIELM